MGAEKSSRTRMGKMEVTASMLKNREFLSASIMKLPCPDKMIVFPLKEKGERYHFL